MTGQISEITMDRSELTFIKEQAENLLYKEITGIKWLGKYGVRVFAPILIIRSMNYFLNEIGPNKIDNSCPILVE